MAQYMQKLINLDVGSCSPAPTRRCDPSTLSEITNLRVLVATSTAFPPRATRGVSRVRQVARSGAFPFFLFFRGTSALKKEARVPQKRGTSASKKEARAP